MAVETGSIEIANQPRVLAEIGITRWDNAEHTATKAHLSVKVWSNGQITCDGQKGHNILQIGGWFGMAEIMVALNAPNPVMTVSGHEQHEADAVIGWLRFAMQLINASFVQEQMAQAQGQQQISDLAQVLRGPHRPNGRHRN